MQLSTNKEALAAPLALVAGAADPRSQVAMLGTVLLKANGGKLSLLCSDTTVVARAMTACQIAEDGEIAVDVKRLNDLVRALPDKQSLDFTLEANGNLLVKSGRSRFRLPTRPAADYPRMTPAKEQRVTLAIGAKRLAQLLEQVAEAVAVADIRSYLNGALVSLGNGFLTLVGTDGFRMVVARHPIAGTENMAAKSVILPRKTALLARRLLVQGGEVKLSLGSSDLQIAFDDGTIIFGKSLEGQFPAWERAIPKAAATAVIESAKLTEAIGLLDATIEAGDKKQARLAELKFGATTLTLSSGEQSRCEIDAECPTPNAQDLTFNVDYLRQSAATVAATCDKVRVAFPDAANVIVLQPAGADYPLAVVMGMRK